jgi:endonuclease G
MADWAYLEDFCRRLTTNFEDVYVFTCVPSSGFLLHPSCYSDPSVPLYMPHRDPDGKWRVVSAHHISLPVNAHPQTYEVIGNPPSISVPTHFAKVILASRPDFSYPQKPNPRDTTVTSPSTIKELAMGAFILPNKEIPDEADIRSFIAPGEYSG